MTAKQTLRFIEMGLGSPGKGEITRDVPVEMPIAFEFAGLAYAVMMATPTEIEDYATGFAFAEGLIERADQLTNIIPAEVEGGIILRADLPQAGTETLRERLRLRLSEGSCGLCGLQGIEEALRPLPSLAARPKADGDAITRALNDLPEHQHLSRATGATHAAALCDASGAILAVREDVGRHNALDKLIGHALRTGIDMAACFIVLTARCSYELVEKTVRAGCPLLVTISAPTTLAVERARAAGLTLVTLARRDTALLACDPYEIFAPEKEVCDGL